MSLLLSAAILTAALTVTAETVFFSPSLANGLPKDGQVKGGQGKDSVAYHPRTKLYFVYRQDSLALWRLSKVLSPEDFLSYKEESLLNERPKDFVPKSESKKDKPKGGLTFSAVGDASLKVGGSVVEDDAPALPASMRRRSYADVLFESNVTLQAGYGEYLRLDLKYNTQSTMVRNRRSLQLTYEGDRFDPIERLQAGHISFVSKNPLITSGSDLFGLRGDFRFGRLKLTALAARQHDMERKMIIGAGGGGMRPFEWKSSDYQFGQHFFLLKSFAESYDERLANLPLVQSNLLVERIEVWVTNEQGYVSEADAVPVMASKEWALTGEKGTTLIKLPAAKRLQEGAYYYNPALGFLSLRVPLGSRQRLGVAFRYTLDGETHQVGTFSSDGGEVEVALLSDEQKVPGDPLWSLMMKNGYPLPQFSNADFTLELLYRDPKSGVDAPADGDGTPWLKLFGLDRTNTSGDGTLSDGLVDNLPGVLFVSGGGTLFLPQRYPFATVPQEERMKYPGLYTHTPYDARKETERDRFILRGRVEGASGQSGGTISLGSADLIPGSVTLSSVGGKTYVEGVDYEIDYAQGTLRMLSPSDEEIEVTIREKELSRAKEKNLLGLEASYLLLPSLSVGGTLLHYYEKAPYERLRLGEEPVKNTLWGLFLRYSDTYPTLTALLDEWLPGRLTGESGLDIGLSYARLHSGYNAKGPVSLEDFDQSGQIIGLTFPQGWKLGSNPFPDETKGKDRRGLLAWFAVDPILTRDGMEGQPPSLVRDAMERANPLVRDWIMTELYPSRDRNLLGQTVLPTLNFSFYPDERGPYASDLALLDGEGKFSDPVRSWASTTFALQVNDFREAQVTYLEGWFIDPYSLDPAAPEGTLLFDIGRVSEDVLPDGRAAYESAGAYDDTPLGRVPVTVPNVYAFDRTGGTDIARQDRGLDGLSDDEERVRFPSDERLGEDPSRDNYRFYLDPFYDQVSAGILERYKAINGTEGNSVPRTVSGLDAASSLEPDREDIDGNFLLETEEDFFRYEMRLSSDMSEAHVIAERTVEVEMPDGSKRRVRWLKFRIPLSRPSSVIGRPLLEDIRSLRLSFHGFSRALQLRFADLRFVSSSWQVFDRALDEKDLRTASASISRLSLEEDGARTPIPYASPPGVERNVTSGAVSLLRADEEAVALSFENLSKDQGTAVFHNPIPWDLRHYRTLSLFAHLETEETLRTGDIELFVRIGSDFTDNFYEVRLPLSETPIADYTHLSPAELGAAVWPDENRLSVDLALLPALKQERDETGHPASELYQGSNRLFVKGYPTLGQISSVLIGIRSHRDGVTKGEVWVNELTVDGTRETGGDAFLATGDLRLSDLLRVRAEGGMTAAGFGSVTQNARIAPLEDLRHLSVRTSWRLDKFLPERFNLSLPADLDFSSFGSTPLYSPDQTDLLFDKERDGERALSRKKEYRLRLDNWRKVRTSSDPKPKIYSLSNLSLAYDLRYSDEKTPQYPSRVLRQMHALFSYDFRPSPDNGIDLSSEWNRLYHKTLFPSSTSSSLQSQWLWRRHLALHFKPREEIALAFTGSTEALVEEPFEAQHLRDEDDDFRLFTSEILRSLAELGSTQRYTGTGEVTLRLPRFSKEKLRTLSATLSLQNSFTWSKGIRTSRAFTGNDVTSRRVADGRVSYDFGDLFPKDAGSKVGLFYLHGRHTSGGAMPGLDLEASKAFGVPSLFLYQLGLVSQEAQIRKAIEKEWFLSPDQIDRRYTPSFYDLGAYEGSLSVTPLRGLEFVLSLSYRSERHTTLDAHSGGVVRRSGAIRMSTVGLKGFLENPLKADGYSSRLFDRFLSEASTGSPVSAFLSSYALSSGHLDRDALPALSSLLPNWAISYDLTTSVPWLKERFTAFKLEHRYNGFVDVPLFDLAEGKDRSSGIPSMNLTDDLNPLFGINLTTRFGLTLKEHFNRRRSFTMMLSSLRILERQDYEVSGFLSYSKSFPALFRLPFPLFEDADHRITLSLSHLYSRSYLLTRTAASGGTMATQGLDTHRLQCSADYAFSRALTVRAFYELTRRRPLVSAYDYPFRRQSYGLLFLLTLR